MSEYAVVSKAKVPAMRMHTVHAAAEQCAPYAIPARPLARAAAASERGGARRTGMREEQRGKSASIEWEARGQSAKPCACARCDWDLKPRPQTLQA